MNRLLLNLCTLALLLGISSAAEKDVVELSDADFKSQLSEQEISLVMFYAPWCGHCKRLKPEYAKAAEELLRHDPPIVLNKVDCTEAGKSTCSDFSVSGYPTLKVFRKGELSMDYEGPRQAAGIVKYMKSISGPASKDLNSIEDLEKFVQQKEAVLVGFFEKESDLKVAFLKLADKLRSKVSFGHSSNNAVLEKQGTKDSIVLFRPVHLQNKFEDNSVAYSGDAEADDIQQFLYDNMHGLVGHRNTENHVEFKNPLIVAYFSVDYVKNAKGTNYWRNRILKVAKEYKGKVNFAVSSKDDFQHELNEYGIDYVKGDKPVILAKDADGRKFAMSKEFTVEDLKQFVDDFIGGKLEPYIKSEAIPESNDGPVKIAVAKNFKEVVTDNGMDTLIEFYAPWCGHCKKLAPIFDELGEKMKSEDIEIVKMDATANDVPPEYEVRGFPTLYWLPKNRDKPVQYNAGRELNDFVKYIAKQATNELNNYDRSGNAKKSEL